MTHLLLWRNSYGQVIRTGRNQIKSLYPLLPDHIEVDLDSKGKLNYTYTISEGNIKLPASEEVLHIPDSALMAWDCISGMKEAIFEISEPYKSHYHNNSAESCIKELLVLPEYPLNESG